MHNLQHGLHQLGRRGQQQTQRDRKRQHPLTHRHMGMTWASQTERGAAIALGDTCIRGAP